MQLTGVSYWPLRAPHVEERPAAKDHDRDISYQCPAWRRSPGTSACEEVLRWRRHHHHAAGGTHGIRMPHTGMAALSSSRRAARRATTEVVGHTSTMQMAVWKWTAGGNLSQLPHTR